jgi:hypothetical protein
VRHPSGDTNNHPVAHKVCLEVLHNILLLDLWDARTIPGNWLSNHMVAEGGIVDAV